MYTYHELAVILTLKSIEKLRKITNCLIIELTPIIVPYNREVAHKPDSGASWVCYMAYWLGLGNVDKARLTARRALDTINYRFVVHYLIHLFICVLTVAISKIKWTKNHCDY